MGEFMLRDAEPGSYVNEHGTSVMTDVTETYDTTVEGPELVLRWFRLSHAADRRGERHDEEWAESGDLVRLDREAAGWLRDELTAFLGLSPDSEGW